jgi:hypothetical protein
VGVLVGFCLGRGWDPLRRMGLVAGHVTGRDMRPLLGDVLWIRQAGDADASDY